MATSQYAQLTSVPVSTNRAFQWSWPGIFAGTFVYLAIESTFGLLGAAIFGTAGNPNGTTSVGVGLQVWMIILSIIALYFAGKTSSKLSYGAADRNLGMYHGLVTFGMSVFATILIVALSLGNAAGALHPASMGGVIAGVGVWSLFVAFVLGAISAGVGGMHGVQNADLMADRSATTKRAA